MKDSEAYIIIGEFQTTENIGRLQSWNDPKKVYVWFHPKWFEDMILMTYGLGDE